MHACSSGLFSFSRWNAIPVKEDYGWLTTKKKKSQLPAKEQQKWVGRRNGAKEREYSGKNFI